MKELLIICGKSGVGKTTLINHLSLMYRWERVMTVTTKPVEGNDYIYVDEREFEEMEDANELVFITERGGYRYGTRIEDLEEVNSVVIALDEKGILEAQSRFKGKVRVICIVVEEKRRYKRLIERGDTIESIYHRSRIDERSSFESLADLVVESKDEGVVELALRIMRGLNDVCA